MFCLFKNNQQQVSGYCIKYLVCDLVTYTICTFFGASCTEIFWYFLLTRASFPPENFRATTAGANVKDETKTMLFLAIRYQQENDEERD